MSHPAEERLLAEIRDLLGEAVTETKVQRQRRVFVTLAREAYKSSIKKLVDRYDVTHISTVTGVDAGENIEVMPHLWGAGVEITIRSLVPKTSPEIDSLVDVLPGAIMYEREVHDLLGVVFKGHPALNRLLLSEDWPEGVHPLRKDFKVERLKPLRKVEGVA